MIRNLQALRFVFIMLVVMSHIIGKSFDFGGECGVSFFFILSGFILSYAYGGKVLAGTFGHRQFLKKQLSKFYPLHVVLFFAMVLLDARLGHFYSWDKLAANLLLLQSWVPCDDFYFVANGLSWFLSDVVFFYLVFPMVFRLLVNIPVGRLLRGAVATLLLYTCLAASIPENMINPILYAAPWTRLLDFSIGILLFRMYTHYADSQGWKVEMIEDGSTELGGLKESVVLISGKNVFQKLKFESGVHRVQRVPVTESSGRIHTSTATVAVLPEAEDVEVEIGPNDLRIDTYRASGAGGQHINRTDSAVRITHIPTGLVVTSQDQRSQIQNREKAMRVLKSRLYELQREQQQGEYADRRRTQVGTGDRSERIRTYNFPQGRVTDHRIGLTLYKIDEIMEGHLDEIIDALTLAEQTALLNQE